MTRGPVRVAIFGASGYTGYELLRLLSGHQGVTISRLFRENPPYGPLETLGGPWAHFQGLYFEAYEESLLEGVDVAFLALPAGSAAPFASGLLKKDIRVIDLSPDFRFRTKAGYEAVYGPHPCPELLEEAVYGLPEFFGESIQNARLVANPGCYATATLLFLYPLVKEGLIGQGPIVADAKSGFSGAGKKPTQKGVFSEVNENFRAYSPLVHRHAPEMLDVLDRLGAKGVPLRFVPHLLPINRGILATLYVPLVRAMDFSEIASAFQARYEGSPFIRLLPGGVLPETSAVRGTNFCDIGFVSVNGYPELVGFSCIDNLTKGASGQAVQNFNLMMGFEQTCALLGAPLYP